MGQFGNALDVSFSKKLSKGEMKMVQKTSSSEVALHSERLGSVKEIQAVLTDWGMDKAAIGRILDEHRTRQASMRKAAVVKVNPTPGRRIGHAPVISSYSPSR
jgi:hypothetical protein